MGREGSKTVDFLNGRPESVFLFKEYFCLHLLGFSKRYFFCELPNNSDGTILTKITDSDCTNARFNIFLDNVLKELTAVTICTSQITN